MSFKKLKAKCRVRGVEINPYDLFTLTMDHKIKESERIVTEYTVECGYCKRRFNGRTIKEVNKNLHLHFMFMHGDKLK